MISRFVAGGALAAIVGASMLLAASAGPSAGFTLSSPTVEQPAAEAGVVPVWWDRWGRWHPNGWGWHPWRPWGWGSAPMPSRQFAIAGSAAGVIVTVRGDRRGAFAA